MLVQPNLFTSGVAAPRHQGRSSTPQEPAPIDFFHQRYDDNFWRTHEPVLDKGALCVTPRLPPHQRRADAPATHKKRAELLRSFFEGSKAPLSVQELCTASLNIQTYNRATPGGTVEHLGKADRATPADTLRALLLQLRTMRQDEAKSPPTTRFNDDNAMYAQDMACTGDSALRKERLRIEGRVAEFNRICEVIEAQLQRVDVDADNDLPLRLAFKAVRRELVHETQRAQEEIALMEARAAAIQRAFDPYRAKDGTGRVVPPADYPVQVPNILRGGNCKVTIRTKGEFRTWSSFCQGAFESMQSLLVKQYGNRVENLKGLTSDIDLWLALSSLPKAQ